MKRSLQITPLFLLFILHSSSTMAQWSSANLSMARTQMGAAAANGVAIFAGGIGMISQPPGVYDQYNAFTGAWTSGNFAPGRNKLAGADCGGQLLFAGGANDWIFADYDNVNI